MLLRRAILLVSVIKAEYATTPWIFEDFEDGFENWEIEVVPDSYNNEYQYYTDR